MCVCVFVCVNVCICVCMCLYVYYASDTHYMTFTLIYTKQDMTINLTFN